MVVVCGKLEDADTDLHTLGDIQHIMSFNGRKSFSSIRKKKKWLGHAATQAYWSPRTKADFW
jgi:hypothetical protein